ncbi:MAG: saccharopine dehydrogenase [Phycisphaerales bacterium]|nr:MAG: saccharopine dehydrogenase [Phycisphaerales bacterium]
MTRVVVLGCGRIGSAIARDLCADSSMRVTVVDAAAASFAGLRGVANLETRVADLGSGDAIRTLVEGADIVIGALPSALGWTALKAVIEAGRPYVDISFLPEDPLQFDGLARQRGVTAVVDCGVAPGLANLLVGHGDAQLDYTERVEYYVGGLPFARRWPYQYKAPFAPLDVLEEYTRPVRLRENGRLVTRPALSEPHLVDFPRVGTLEAFNTDGLRTLLTTIAAPNMREMTLRYPGHAELMRVLRETGLFGKDPIEVAGVTVRPIDVTARLLFPHWELEAGEAEFTVLRVVVSGLRGGRPATVRFDLLDKYDPATGLTSMARTTAFPCAIVARMIAEGTFRRPGVTPPEVLGREDALVQRMLEELARRGVNVRRVDAPGP